MLPYETIANQEHIPEVKKRLIEAPGFNLAVARVALLSLDGDVRLGEYGQNGMTADLANMRDTIASLSDEFDIQPPLMMDAKKSNPKTTLSGRMLGFMLSGSTPTQAFNEASVHEYLITGKFEDGTKVDVDTLSSVVEKICELDKNDDVPFHTDDDTESRIQLVYSALESSDIVALEQLVQADNVDMTAIADFVSNSHELPDEIHDHLDSLRFDMDEIERLREKVIASNDPGQMTRFNLIAESAGVPLISKKKKVENVAHMSGRRARSRSADKL